MHTNIRMWRVNKVNELEFILTGRSCFSASSNCSFSCLFSRSTIESRCWRLRVLIWKKKHPELLLVWYRWSKICSVPQVSYANTTSTPYLERKQNNERLVHFWNKKKSNWVKLWPKHVCSKMIVKLGAVASSIDAL